MINSFVATAAAALSWMFVEWMVKGKPSLLGACPAASRAWSRSRRRPATAGPMGAIVLGLDRRRGLPVLRAPRSKNAFGYDDALDVFGVHCIGGIVGAHRHRHPGEPDARRRRHHGLHRPARSPTTTSWRRSSRSAEAWLTTLVWSGVGSLITLQGGRRAGRTARAASRRSAKASISPITASAPTTCNAAPRHASCAGGSRRRPPVRRPRSHPGPLLACFGLRAHSRRWLITP